MRTTALAVIFASGLAFTGVTDAPPALLASAGTELDCGKHLTYRSQATLGEPGTGGAASPAGAVELAIGRLADDLAITRLAVVSEGTNEAQLEFQLNGLPARAHAVRPATTWVLEELVACVPDPALLPAVNRADLVP